MVTKISYEQVDWYEEGEVEAIYNATKNRKEIWVPCSGGVSVLYNAIPSRIWADKFGLGPNLVPGALGLQTELPWSINGRMNGAVLPDSTVFLPANLAGGGLNIIVKAGGQIGDYTAIHWGGNYPMTASISPHISITADFQDNVNVGYIAGIMCATNKPTGTNAYGLADNGIFLIVDTNIFGDDHLRCIVRVGGVNTDITDVGAAPPGLSCGHIVIDDAGTSVQFILNGVVVRTYTGALPACQLQPYAAIVAYAVLGAEVTMTLNDFKLIMDQ